MAITFTSGDIATLVKRFENDVIYEQALMESAVIDKGVLKKITKKTVRGTVNVKAGKLAATGWIADGGSLPAGGDVTPDKLNYDPKILFTRLQIPRAAAKIVASYEDGVDLVQEEMESAAEDLGQQLGRGVFTGSLGSTTAAVSAGDTTFTTADPSGFRVGMSVDVYNSTTFIETVRVSDVNLADDPEDDSTITFTGGGAGSGAVAAWTTSYTLYQKGAQSNTMDSLSDAASDTGSLYGKAATSDEWHGNLSAETELTLTHLRNLSTNTKRRGGSNGKKRWTHSICNSVNEQRYSDLLVTNRRFAPGQKMDAVGDSYFEFEGKPVFCDDNVQDTHWFLFNQNDVKLHEFVGFSAEVDGGKDAQLARGAMLVDPNVYAYDVQVDGIYNLRVTRRAGLGMLNAIAS